MNIAARIRSLDYRQLFVISKAFLFRPLFIVPTLKATRETIRICDNNFGRSHHKNTPANAFRHALWNFLICEKCYKISGSVEKVTNWSRKITDLHEKIAPNGALARQMDLHNNHIGRKIFEEHFASEIEIISILKEKMEEAVKISDAGDIEKAQNKLVFIEN